MKINKIDYRPEIDGLRAISIIAVIFYHAQIKIFGYEPFKGGFIGVDIFFVISGYLITSIILKEIISTGKISLLHFYERRIKRIIPVLLLVITISLPFAWFYLLPNDLTDFANSILYSLGFSSNFYFHFSGQEYGAQNSLLKPFLHTWSLSIEEQFYIIFPLFLIVIYKYFKNYILHIFIFIFIFSLGFSDWGSKNYPSSTFYFLPSRIWELILGSILAYFEIKFSHRSKNKKLNLILPIIGLLLIGLSIFFLNNIIPHPSFFTLIPIIGVCLVIWFSNKDSFVTKLLSYKLFVSIGLISYSLYLFHYPIFAFARYINFTDGSLLKKISLVIILFLSSIISYFFIEKKIRNTNFNFLSLIKYILFVYFFIIIFSLLINKNLGFASRLPEILKIELHNRIPWLLLEDENKKACHDNLNGCHFFTNNNDNLFLVGDSHLSSILNNLVNRNDMQKYSIHTYTFGGCHYFPHFNQINIKTNKISEHCNAKTIDKIKNAILKKKNSTIIFFGRLPLYFSLNKFDNKEGGVESGRIDWGLKFVKSKNGKYINIQESFIKEILLLADLGNKIIIVNPYPEAGWHVPQKIIRTIPRNFYDVPVFLNNHNNFISTSYKVYQDRVSKTNKILESLKHSQISNIYTHDLVCNTLISKRCLNHDNKNIYYRDDDHPSQYMSEKINDLIIKELKKSLKKE